MAPSFPSKAPGALKRATLGLLALLLATPAAADNYDPPSYAGYTLLWSDAFAGSAGAAPSTATWNIRTGYLGVNAELEAYTASNANLQLSGGSTLQIVPWRDASAAYGWTSGRIESVGSWTPAAGAVTRVEAVANLGTDPTSAKQGLWPAFWLLAQSYRTGAASWPDCGELDIFEAVNGVLTGYGTAHCGSACNDNNAYQGLAGTTGIPDSGWHTWRLEWDRTSGNWATETIRWSRDGTVFQTLTGSSFSEGVWATLAHSPYYIILNLAVGGSWVSFSLFLPFVRLWLTDLFPPTARRPQLGDSGRVWIHVRDWLRRHL